MSLQKEILTPKYPHLLHGGDYNPEQWLDKPEILKRDIELMKKAKINCVSLGIFAWSKLEPSKDDFHLDWMEEIINNLYSAGIYVDLATPSGARPRWIAKENCEVLRVDERGKRAHFGGRHNHCMSSPYYRDRVAKIDMVLAKRFSDHPGVIMWHISNEFEGECHCDLCQQAFRRYLRDKYTTIGNLNRAWWTTFWSHDYSGFEEIESPKDSGENTVNGLTLDWKRFVTNQTVDFMNNEINTVKKYAPNIPVTTNMMGLSDVLCYPRLAQKLDFVSWDSYPNWHEPGQNTYEGALTSFTHDYMRCLKNRPFILMESTTSTVNWRPVCKIKKPGMHRLSMLDAIGHGSQSAMYFQIRQSLGGPEKFHSAVISHLDSDDTRVFKEVASLGEELESVSDIIYGTYNYSEVAIIYDKESKWALDGSSGPRNESLDYDRTCVSFYEYFWQHGINVDVIDSSASLDEYKLVIAPMLYMYHNGIEERIRKFVQRGGYVVSTAFSGYVNETDLCFSGNDADRKLSDVFGICIEEIDALYDEESNLTTFEGKEYPLHTLCEIVKCVDAKALSVYEKDFYKGFPVITVNKYGDGTAYHIASYSDQGLYDALFNRICDEAGIYGVLGNTRIPPGIGIVSRRDKNRIIVFAGNYTDERQIMHLCRNSVSPGRKAIYYINGDIAECDMYFDPFEMKMIMVK